MQRCLTVDIPLHTTVVQTLLAAFLVGFAPLL